MTEPTPATPRAARLAGPSRDGLAERLDAALERAVARMFELQHPDGYWWAELESNVTMVSEHLMLERFLGLRDETRWRKIVRYLLDHQREDGSWAIYYGGPGDVSVTIEAYFALKLAGYDPDSPPMARARRWILDHGGIGAARVFTKLWLALFGQFDWRALPAMPPEIIWLPPRFPFNIYEFASWARATIVAILVVWHYKPVVDIAPEEGVQELYLDPRDRSRIRYHRGERLLSWKNFFLSVDHVLRAVDRLPPHPWRERALAACERWIVAHQEADGSWGGIQPPWVYSIIALRCRGYSLDHPVMAKAIRGLLVDFALEDERWFTVQPCVSPVWDTALMITGLREAGVPADHPRLRRAADWLAEREIRFPGDWTVKVPRVEPSGWAFEFANDWYPDTDDTAEVLIALRLVKLGRDLGPLNARATAWLRAMQSSNGGWGAFDKDNTKRFVAEIPFCDFGEVIDPPSEDVTAHVVEWLALQGATRRDPAVRRALRYLYRTQCPDGSWFGRWGVNYLYGLGAVLPALAAVGEDRRSAPFRKAVRWLETHQNPDGGWGETCASYDDPALAGVGPSTASQTAWALLALLAAGETESEAVRRGVEYLIRTQEANGEWEEPYFTGTGFPRDFMLKYHYYRLYWPLWALGRYRRLLKGNPIHLPGCDPWS
jgi:squalene-hopene/tetraprenyl-beta-curcumene cyclase